MAECHRLNHPLDRGEPLLNTGGQANNQEIISEVLTSLETFPDPSINRKTFVNIPGLTPEPPLLRTPPDSRRSSYREPIPEVSEAPLGMSNSFRNDVADFEQSITPAVSSLHCHSGYSSRSRVYTPSVSNESSCTTDSGYLSDSLPLGRVKSFKKATNSDKAMARFLFAILKQKNLKDIDWTLVANDSALSAPITNGHAARMRFSRFRSTILSHPGRKTTRTFDEDRTTEPCKQDRQSRGVDLVARNPEEISQDDSSQKFDSRISTSSIHSTLNFHKDEQMNNDPKTHSDILASIENEDSTPEHNKMQEIKSVIRDAPTISSTGNDTSEADSTSKEENISRSPSPWQTANNTESEQLLSESLCWAFKRSSNETLSSRASVDSFPYNSVEDIPAENTHGDTVTLVAGSSSGSIAPTAAGLVDSESNQAATNSFQGNSKRSRASSNLNKNSEDEDSDEPDQKRSKSTRPEQQLFRLRFACPYQKFDPLGSPFCCMPSNKNLEGGAETFPRVKSHIFRNHDPFIRCNNCWKTCKNEHMAEVHKIETNCIQRASPGKYWMTREQREEVRQRKFIAGNIESWFCLFGILLPSVPADGPYGYKKLSPYYTPPQPGPPTPAPSSVESGNRSLSKRQTPSTEPAPSSVLQIADSSTRHQSFGPQIRGSPSDDAVLTTFLNDGAYSAIDDLFRWDDPNHALGGPIDLSIQPDNDESQGPQSGTTTSAQNNWPIATIDPSRLNSFEPDTLTNQFLRQDNARLSNSNAQLQEEVEMLRKQQEESQARLNNIRARLRSLDRSLQNLLYMPNVQASGEELSTKLFMILDETRIMSKISSLGFKIE